MYLLSPSVFHVIKEVSMARLACHRSHISQVFLRNHDDDANTVEEIYFETDVLPKLVAAGKLYCFHSQGFWCQIKTPG